MTEPRMQGGTLMAGTPPETDRLAPPGAAC
jgi:hypothetical protein